MVHSIKQLVFVDESSDDKIDQSEAEDQPRTGKNAVHDADNEYKDRRREVESVAEYRRLCELRVVSRSFGAHQEERIQEHTTKLKQSEWEKPQSLEDDEVNIKRS